ncbi:MAG: copper transporter [Candidatus Microthrix sp.]|uniref:Copper transporter n=1 Tax=Candidatus Neomicrothrix subdominans TaxID=2954438 RepID=A0A936NHL2_9ACTN|nr:copper transporter [Candidatus Microthrix subdominans]
MIKLRTHIISLTAVFLALGIGLVLGSTFLDRTFVDALDAQVRRLNDRVDQRTEEVEALNRVIDEQTLTEEAAADAGYEQLLAGQLTDAQVVVLANRGIDEDQVNRTVEVLQAADAEVPAVVWLTDRWNPTDPQRSAEIAESLDLDTTDPAQVTAEAAAMLGLALAGPTPATNAPATTAPATTAPATNAPSTTAQGDPTTTAPTDGAASTSTTGISPGTTVALDAGPEELLERLTDAELIEQEAAPAGNLSVPGPEALIVSITGEGSSLDPKKAYLPIVTELVSFNPGRVLVAETRNTRTIQAEATEDDVPVRGAALEVVRSDDALRGQSSTLDGLESPLGKAAVVVALMELREGKTGDYGLAAGTDGPVPSITR